MLKVVDLLELPSMGQSYIVAGHDGAFTTIKKLEVMEEPYPFVQKFLVPYGFILTNFWSMKDDKKGRISLVKSMIERRCAGIGIMPGPHLNGIIDPEIIELANQNSFPILCVDVKARWGNIISEYGVLAHSNMMPSFDEKLDDVVNAFLEYQAGSDGNRFCHRVSRLVGLPMIMSTDTVFSSGEMPVNVALIVAKVQSICQTGRNALMSPMTVRITNDYLAVVHLGKRALVAVCINNNTLNDSMLQLFHRIAPTIVRELDKHCSLSLYTRSGQALANLGDQPMFFVMIKDGNYKNIEEKLNYDYIIYEKNPFFKYCILLIADHLEKKNEVYGIYRQIYEQIKPELLIFSSKSFYRKDLINEIEPLKYMVNTLSYLEGIYSVDELPLLYILAYAPFEYKSHMFIHYDNGLSPKEGKKEFLDTLRLCVALRNTNDVSSLLGIHINSVKYRVEKALKILGYEEENILGDVPSVRLLLQLELIVLDN